MSASIATVRTLLTLALFLSATCQLPAAEPSPAPPELAYIHVVGEINPMQARYYQRAIEEARALGVDVILTHIDSNGGRLDSCQEMVQVALGVTGPDAPRMIAFVDSKAISAAAALAYAHDEIYMTTGSTIGDIGVIFQKPDGSIEYAPEKIETFVRAWLSSIADVRGWNQALLVKMTARNQILYEIRDEDGGRDFVLSDDLPRYLADHPEIDRDDPNQVINWRGEDRLLTFPAEDAVAFDMASGIVTGLDQLYQHLDVDSAASADLAPSPTEMVARTLVPIAPLLAGLALLFVIFELKTPGVGVWAGLAIVAGAGFFVCQFYQEMASNLEVVLILLGVALLAVEFFTAVGAGAIGIGGGVLILLGLVLSFMPDEIQFDPAAAENWGAALTTAMLRSLMAAVVLVVGIGLIIATLPHSGLMRRLAVVDELRSTSAGRVESGAESLVGHTGRARSPLHPSGVVAIGDEEFSAHSEHGVFIAEGSAVEVLGARFGELLVRAQAADDDPAPADAEQA